MSRDSKNVFSLSVDKFFELVLTIVSLGCLQLENSKEYQMFA